MPKQSLVKVKTTGLKTTFQDQGRHGYQSYGVPVSGVMDMYAYQVGNLLLGNDRYALSIEVSLLGPALEVLSDVVIALTGADLSPHTADRPLPMWQAVRLYQGEVLSFGRLEKACMLILVCREDGQRPRLSAVRPLMRLYRWGI